MPSATPVRAAMRTFKTAFNTSQVRRQSTLQLRGRNNMHLFRKVGRTAAAFFPFYAFVLGWPVSILHIPNSWFSHILIIAPQFLVSGYGKRYGI